MPETLIIVQLDIVLSTRKGTAALVAQRANVDHAARFSRSQAPCDTISTMVWWLGLPQAR